MATAPDGSTGACIHPAPPRSARSTVLPHACSTATARTATPCLRPSTRSACRWWIAASSTPSPISAAAPRRAGAGTRDGKREQEDNTFTDFIAAARAAGGNGYTRAGRIVAQGRSAGGMLMGAVANMAPELFAAHHRRSALRRRAQHDARRDAAAHAAGMAGMGQPHRERSRFPHDRGLFALRERRAPQAYPPSSRSAASPIPASPIGSRRNGWRRSARRRPRADPCCCASTWTPAMAARPAASTG